MTPGQRLQAAIEIFASLRASARAGDRLLAGWFRAHRQAGAKDRRAIGAMVYGASRRSAELQFRLEQARIVAAARPMILAASGLTLDELRRQCDGGPLAPAPLDAAEILALGQLGQPLPEDAPDWARYNYPAWLDGRLKARFGGAIAAEIAALDARAPLDLRVNRLKADRDQVLAALIRDGMAPTPTPLSPLGLRLTQHQRLEKHHLFRDGLIEPQDEAAQIAALLVGAAPGMQVIDYCAGAGGKTLALAAAMKNSGQIHALDRASKRLDRLRERLARAGARNVQVHLLTEDDSWLARFAGSADRVLLDAPCTGTGTWRRNPEARWRLTPEMLGRHIQRQHELSIAAAGLVRPGGRLIYATCSLLIDEDEARIAGFLRERPDFTPVPMARVWAETIGGDCPAEGTSLVLTPHRHGTDGFFVAVLERRP